VKYGINEVCELLDEMPEVEKDKIQPCIAGLQYPIAQSIILPGLSQREKVSVHIYNLLITQY
jgi:hypothetical protein